MKLSFFIAKRYLFGKKSHNLINILSGISVTGLIIGSMSLVIVLSVMNGFEKIITQMYNSFNADIRIEAVKGKTINLTNFPVGKIKGIKGIAAYSEVIEENALIKYKNKQQIVLIKGVDENFTKVSSITSKIVEGKYLLQNLNADFMVLGYGIYDQLEIQLNDYKTPVSIYIPKRDKAVSIDPSQAFNNEEVFPMGAFSIQQDFDTKYVLVSYRLAQNLLDYKTEVTAIELAVLEKKDLSDIQEEIQQLIGNEYTVKNRYQQEEMLFKVIKSEKFAIFLILSFIILIAAFNLIGSISMLILEKKQDILILRSLGASNKLIKRIFFAEGLMISLAGAFIGIILGGIISWLQQEFGLIKLQGSGSFIIEAYPVQIQLSDFLLVALIVCVIGFVAAWFPIHNIDKKMDDKVMDV